MPLVTLAFTFTQKLPADVATTYAWATDYRPSDIGLLGKDGHRGVKRLNQDTLVLSDKIVRKDGSSVTRKKLVRLYPEVQMWTNTHITGEFKHSQFIYQLAPAGKDACTLTFTGRQVFEEAKAPSAKEVAKRSAELAKEDKEMWVGIAKAMAKDVAAAKKAPTKR